MHIFVSVLYVPYKKHVTFLFYIESDKSFFKNWIFSQNINMEYQFICLKPLIRCRCLTAYLKQMFPALLVHNSIFAWSSLSLIRSVDLAWAPARRRALRFLFPQPEKNFTTFFPASLVSSAASATSLHHFPGYYGKSQTELKFCSPST